MANDEAAGAGARIAPGLLACGAGIVAWVVLARRVRALERRVDEVARKAELACHTRVTKDLPAEAATCTADLHGVSSAVQDMICRAEAAQRPYGPLASQD